MKSAPATSTMRAMTEHLRTTPADKEIELFARFIDGDTDAFTELFDRFNHRLYLYCLKIVGDSQQAEDLTQELWERVIGLQAGRPVVTAPARLLFRIARNLCLQYLKSQRRLSPIEDLPESSHPVSTTPELSHLEELVVISLARLPFEHREILVLNAYCGYSYEEIAGMRGESLGAVKMRAWRARSRMGRLISAMLALQEDMEIEPGVEPDTE
jgi:RNA polymerase sigma-70 factor (ECF subfamily)